MAGSIARRVEDYLIEGLSFKLNPGASYVTDRRSVSFFTAGSTIYQSGSGARVIRTNLTGEGWLDPSTARLSYTLVNNEGRRIASCVRSRDLGASSVVPVASWAVRSWMTWVITTERMRCSTS